MKERKSSSTAAKKEKEAVETAAPQSTGAAMSEKGTELGVIKIHENVIASIVRKATLGIDGVSRLAGSSFVDNIAEFVGSRKISDRAIRIELEEDKVKVEVKVNIKFGFRVPETAAAIQSTIIEQVENTSGMTVTSVNVVVQEIEEELPPEVAAETED